MRCTLRPYVPSDQDAFFALFGDPEVVRWVDDGQFENDRIRRLFARILTLETGPTEQFAFVLAVWFGDRLIGHIELKQTAYSQPDEWELVYVLARHVWGRGLGSELATWAMQTTHGEGRRLIATVDPDNAVSLRILTRCGLRERARLADGTVVLGEPEEVSGSL